jgi:hypothetical protein
MVSGDRKGFPYRSSTHLTRFFRKCDLDETHVNQSRVPWTRAILERLNEPSFRSNELPSDQIMRVIAEVLDEDEFRWANDRLRSDEPPLILEKAVEDVNTLLAKDGIEVSLDASGKCHFRNTGSGVMSSAIEVATSPLSPREQEQRRLVTSYLESASEDDFTTKLLVPLFQRLGFRRVNAAGHSEKALEFGKDLWMKFQLPTGHWIYFGAQVKRERLDAKGAGGSTNIATVLSQVLMGLDHPIFDHETNRKVLCDHFFVISSEDITKQARTWLVEKLDTSQRRQIIFMDRDDFLNLAARILIDLNLREDSSASTVDAYPF